MAVLFNLVRCFRASEEITSATNPSKFFSLTSPAQSQVIALTVDYATLEKKGVYRPLTLGRSLQAGPLLL